MKKSKFRKRVISITIIAIILIIIMLPFKLPYKINVIGEIKPSKEWVFVRGTAGQLSTKLFDNEKGVTQNYDIIQSERGEDVNFILHPSISAEKGINVGDTIGTIYSSKVERRLSKLEGELQMAQVKLKSLKNKTKIQDMNSKIEALGKEKETLIGQKESFVVISPFGGIISQFLASGVLFAIYDTSSYVILMSIPSEYMKYLEGVKKVKYSSGKKKDSIGVELFFVSKERKQINGKEAGVAKAIIRGNPIGVSPGMLIRCSIDCEQVTLLEYIKRFFDRLIT